MIADRWLFERKPDTYKITITPESFTIQEEQTQQLTVTVHKNNELISTTPKITYTVNDDTVVSVDPETNIATGLKEGNTTITGSYIAQESDICTPDTVAVEITAKPVVAEIVVTSPYSSGLEYYKVRQFEEITFTASIAGVSSPQWTITLDPQGIPSSYYTSSINNSACTFTVECKTLYNGKYLKYTISEATTGKTLDYYIALVSMFG